MKRIVFLTLAASVLTSCERPTGPATHGPPAFATTAATHTTFSGEATVLQATVLGLPPIVVGRAGPLPESGGAEESSVLSVSRDETFGLASAEVVHAATVGQGNSSSADVFVANPSLTVAGNAIEADVLRSQAEASCNGGQASASGSSEVAGLVINGSPIAVSGSPNDTAVDLPGLRVVINEQSGSASGNQADITVNALHITAFNLLTGEKVADVVISSAHADITCAACTEPVGDFVTGGGWITGTPSGARANFGVAGGVKNGGLWGHLIYIDHGPGGIKVKGTSVTSYDVLGPTSRRITGRAEVDGVGDVGYTVDVTDAGEPGREDTFSITLDNGYSASGPLAGGNIQLHVRPGPCP
ncbi:MAG TPA: choice-of-anchor P family protein [Gemmatimonadales bacterium]|jgi:hypothetical protein